MIYTKYIFIFSIFFATANIANTACLKLTNNLETTQKSVDYLLNNNTIKPFPNSTIDNKMKELVKYIAIAEIYFQKKFGHENLLQSILKSNSDFHNLLQVNNFKFDESYTQELFSMYEQTHQDYILLTPLKLLHGNTFMIDYDAQCIVTHRNNPEINKNTPAQTQSNITSTNSNLSSSYTIPLQPAISGN